MGRVPRAVDGNKLFVNCVTSLMQRLVIQNVARYNIEMRASAQSLLSLPQSLHGNSR